MLIDYVGTENGGIGLRQKMGTSTLGLVSANGGDVVRHRLWSNYSKDDQHYYVILIRDVLSKWKSGYIEELKTSKPWICAGAGRLFHFNVFENGFLKNDKNTLKIINLMKEMHDPYGIYGIYWMYHKLHSCFWLWNNAKNVENQCEDSFTQLDELINLPNIYFLELKDLSNPKFLEWLQEKDDNWNRISEIPYSHKTPGHFKSQIELFWEQYKKGKILVDQQLFSPLMIESVATGWIEDMMYHYHSGELELLKWKFKHQQTLIDNIRKESERYLNFK